MSILLTCFVFLDRCRQPRSLMVLLMPTRRSRSSIKRPLHVSVFPSLCVLLFANFFSLVTLTYAKSAPAKPTRALPPFEWLKPTPATLAAAEKAGWSLNGLSIRETPATLQSGDAVIAMVTLIKEKTQEQWLVRLATVDLTEAERVEASKERKMTFYTTTGNEFEFGGRRTAFSLHVLGPFFDASQKAKKREDKSARILTTSDFLGLGFDRAADFFVRDQSASKEGPSESGTISFSNRPYPPEVLEKAKNNRATRVMTAEDERAVVGTLPALLEFFNVSSQTPGLKEIVRNVVDIPWWALVKSGGRVSNVNIDFGSHLSQRNQPKNWPLNAPLYTLPFTLMINSKDSLVCIMGVTAPKPPLLASAGIIGIAAGQPSGKGPRLMLQIVGVEQAP